MTYGDSTVGIALDVRAEVVLPWWPFRNNRFLGGFDARKDVQSSSIVLLPLLYVLIFGPACWISNRMERGETAVSRIYQQMMRL
jgi:hypothetical protein